MKRLIFLFAAMVFAAIVAPRSEACTGISLSSQDGGRVVARTVEWAATPMQCGYMVTPRGHKFQSYTPTGDNGLKYTGIYGFVGIENRCRTFLLPQLWGLCTLRSVT